MISPNGKRRRPLSSFWLLFILLFSSSFPFVLIAWRLGRWGGGCVADDRTDDVWYRLNVCVCRYDARLTITVPKAIESTKCWHSTCDFSRNTFQFFCCSAFSFGDKSQCSPSDRKCSKKIKQKLIHLSTKSENLKIEYFSLNNLLLNFEWCEMSCNEPGIANYNARMFRMY